MTSDQEAEVRLARSRLRVVTAAFVLALLTVAARLIDLALEPDPSLLAVAQAQTVPSSSRVDIVDRNGILLATDYPKVSLFADPQEVLDPATAADRLSEVVQGVRREELLARLREPRRFVWLKRHIPDAEQRAVIRLGLPGIKFRTEQHRVYPQGRLAAHVVGFVGVENQGLAGIERSFEERISGVEGGLGPLALTIDIRLQEVVRSTLQRAITRFRSQGGSGLVLDAARGEILALVSLPDFDPNRAGAAGDAARFNRNTQGSYELGSLFKLFTAAMALDAGVVDIAGGFDASEPLAVGRRRIRDFHAKRRWLSVPEIIAFSSNIGAAKMAQAVGEEAQLGYFRRLALLERHHLRLPEVGAPQIPDPWRPINSITAAYGHGIAVSPLQTADALAVLLCGSPHRPAHLTAEAPPDPVERGVVSPQVSLMLRWLMWLAVSEGTGKLAQVPGYLIGGKTGSADQAGPGGYVDGRLLSSFIGAFPMDAPRYIVLVTLDRPEGDAVTGFQAHGGWTAAPVAGEIMGRMGPLLGLAPATASAADWFRARLKTGERFNARSGRLETTFGVAPALAWDNADFSGRGSCGCKPCLNPA